MSALSHQDVDGLILSFAKVQWRKVAMIMSQVLHECRDRGVDVDVDSVEERICALVENGQLEAQGNLSSWRHGEVKLPD
jgi:hypothetical protein